MEKKNNSTIVPEIKETKVTNDLVKDDLVNKTENLTETEGEINKEELDIKTIENDVPVDKEEINEMVESVKKEVTRIKGDDKKPLNINYSYIWNS